MHVFIYNTILSYCVFPSLKTILIADNRCFCRGLHMWKLAIAVEGSACFGHCGRELSACFGTRNTSRFVEDCYNMARRGESWPSIVPTHYTNSIPCRKLATRCREIYMGDGYGLMTPRIVCYIYVYQNVYTFPSQRVLSTYCMGTTIK